jgi:hypothetical protein
VAVQSGSSNSFQLFRLRKLSLQSPVVATVALVRHAVHPFRMEVAIKMQKETRAGPSLFLKPNFNLDRLAIQMDIFT